MTSVLWSITWKRLTQEVECAYFVRKRKMKVFKIHWMLETGTNSFKQTNTPPHTHTLALIIHLAECLWLHKHKKKMSKTQCKSLSS